MITHYKAFSWTLTPAELKKIIINNIKEGLDRGIKLTEAKLIGDPDRLEILKAISEITADLEAGKDSPKEWEDVVAWSWHFQELDQELGGGSIGKCTYYAAIGDIEIPRMAIGKTSTLIDREGLHLDLQIEVIV